MNPDIAAALAEMDKVSVSNLEHPGSWALDPASCRFLAAFIRATGAARVLEFGSGFSSLMIARELAGKEGNLLFSVDDSANYSSLAKESVDNSDVAAKVEFRVAPLKPKFYGPRLLLTYGLPAGLLEAKGPFDLVLIDAPHEDYGREAVLYDAFSAVAPGGYLILDDANREGMEREYLRSWKQAYGELLQATHLEGIGNGLCVIEKFDEGGRGPLPFGESLKISLKTLRNWARLLAR